MKKINIINKSNNSLPTYATEGSAGMDLRANLDKEVIIKSLERCAIPTGIFIELPIGYEAQIRPRSGLALNSGITILNTPGTIDSDYRGEIKIILMNLSNQDFSVKHGDRIGQMIISKYETIELNSINEFEVSTKRGAGGFGHTGK
jgi:dUTP pyrophosphatase